MKAIFEVTDEMVRVAKEQNPGAVLTQIDSTLDDERVFSCVVKKPGNASVARYIQALSTASKGKKDVEPVHRRFCMDQIVVPSPEVFCDLIDSMNLPLLSTSLASDLIEGHGIITESKKKIL